MKFHHEKMINTRRQGMKKCKKLCGVVCNGAYVTADRKYRN